MSNQSTSVKSRKLIPTIGSYTNTLSNEQRYQKDEKWLASKHTTNVKEHVPVQIQIGQVKRVIVKTTIPGKTKLSANHVHSQSEGRGSISAPLIPNNYIAQTNKREVIPSYRYR